jgi:mercuric ion binding protein
MKHIVSSTLLLLLFSLISINLYAVEGNKTKQKPAKVSIKTTAQCNMCKKKIEAQVKNITGVEKAVLAVGNGIIKVQFNPNTTNADNIRKAIAEIGYDADNFKADVNAYNSLPACCKLGGHK